MYTRKICVMVVDDAELVVHRITQVLQELPSVKTIIGAYSYREAIDSLHGTKPDIILLDIQLPDKNGIELLGHIKKYHPGIKTVMLTNKSGVYYRSLCEKEGCDHFVDKSEDFENIAGIIESYAISAA